jgi:hypothetical protein
LTSNQHDLGFFESLAPSISDSPAEYVAPPTPLRIGSVTTWRGIAPQVATCSWVIGASAVASSRFPEESVVQHLASLEPIDHRRFIHRFFCIIYNAVTAVYALGQGSLQKLKLSSNLKSY